MYGFLNVLWCKSIATFYLYNYCLFRLFIKFYVMSHGLMLHLKYYCVNMVQNWNCQEYCLDFIENVIMYSDISYLFAKQSINRFQNSKSHQTLLAYFNRHAQRIGGGSTNRIISHKSTFYYFNIFIVFIFSSHNIHKSHYYFCTDR